MKMFSENNLAKFFTKCYDVQFTSYKSRFTQIRRSDAFFYILVLIFTIRFSLSLFCLQTRLCNASIAGKSISLMISSLAGNSVSLAVTEIISGVLSFYLSYMVQYQGKNLIEEMVDYYHAFAALSRQSFKEALTYDYRKLYLSQNRYQSSKFKEIFCITIVLAQKFSEIIYFLVCKLIIIT